MKRIWLWLNDDDRTRIELLRANLGTGDARPSVASVLREVFRRGMMSLETTIKERNGQ